MIFVMRGMLLPRLFHVVSVLTLSGEVKNVVGYCGIARRLFILIHLNASRMSNNLPLTALVVIFLSACMSPESRQHARDPVNEALVKAYVDAQLKADLQGMEDLLADNYRGYGPGIADSVNKTIELTNWKRNMDSVFSSIGYDRYGTLSTHVDSGRVAGDWVFDWALVTLNYKSGEAPVKFWSHAVFRIKDGKINLSRRFMDRYDTLRQRGFILTSSDSTKK
jgi:ketosteroid isomerase-like protein